MLSYEEAEKKLPNFLVEMLQKQYKNEIVKKIIEGYSTKRKVTFRANTIKTTSEIVGQVLENQQIEFERIPWSKEAFIINNVNEKKIEEMKIYQNGEIYLQSLSSMLPPIILNPAEGADILDMAAAPGGKTTQMAAISQNKANITACEMNEIRAERLKYNVEKQGATSVYIMKKDARKLDDFFSFDQILLDSPCSGSGTIDVENKNLGKYFTEKLLYKCTRSQLELLRKAIKILKPGKEMVYSTCSILKEENEEIIHKILKETNTEIIPIKFEGMEELPLLPTIIEGTVCVCPNEYYEGFYIAKIRKIK